MAGCGLGYIAFGHQDNSKVMQVLAATVNDIVSPKTSAITSGTSGCTEDGAVKLMAQRRSTAPVNFDSLRREMAMGHGNSSAPSRLFWGERNHQTAMLKLFQNDYAYFFRRSTQPRMRCLKRLSDRWNSTLN